MIRLCQQNIRSNEIIIFQISIKNGFLRLNKKASLIFLMIREAIRFILLLQVS
jgi:hypothetical protein